MASEGTLQRLQAEFDNSPDHIQTVVALLEEGATPDFICRFRRDESGDMRSERVVAVAERLHFLEDIVARKTAILEQAEQKGMASDELRQTLERCFDQDQLDDIYQTFRPRRRTAGVQAREKGLGEIADAILKGDLEGKSLTDWADQKIAPDHDLPTREAVLEGVLHILAEHFAGHPNLRGRIRHELQNGILRAKVREGADRKRGAGRYKEFFDFEKPVRRMTPQQMLGLRHAERDGLITVQLALPEGKAKALFREACPIDPGEDQILAGFLDLVFEHTYENLIRPSCANDVRHRIKERADRETVRSLARNLRSQLLAPPLGPKKTLGLRASRKTVWVAVVNDDGSVAKHHSLPVGEDEQRETALQQLATLLQEDSPAGVALPHGRHQEVSYEFLNAAIGKMTGQRRPLIVPVDEAASAIHATSASSRREMPDLDVGIRTAVSLARRMQDPMHELLGLEPKALGLGHNLDEVHQGILSRHLDSAIASCVGKIGLDVNSASLEQLVRAPGMTRETAKKILEARKKDPFQSLSGMREQLGIGENEFRFCSGFLRLRGGTEPLDNTGVHPDDYPLATRIAEQIGATGAEVLGHPKLRGLKSSEVRAAAGEEGKSFPELRLRDVIRCLSTHNHDPRGELRGVDNHDVTKFEDLTADKMLRGRITNLTEFGAFVDLGIGQDGLIHISQIPPSRLRDPERMLAVGEVVTVFVVKVDPKGKRISLTMHKPRHVAEGRQPTIGERLEQITGRRGAGRGRREEPQIQSRAARAPGGRRPGGRRGPPQPGAGGDSRGPGRERRPRGDYGGGGRGRPSTPKVVTVESGLDFEESRGHKGELRSLSSLANLLSGGAKKAPEAKAPEIEAPEIKAPEIKAPETPATTNPPQAAEPAQEAKAPTPPEDGVPEAGSSDPTT